MAIGHWNESVTHLIPGYRNTRASLERSRNNTDNPSDKEKLGSMISDCTYALEWLETGRRPGSMRGIEHAYKTSTWDPAWLDSYASPNGWYTDRTQFSGELSQADRFRIEDAMSTLSDRERQCFMMYHVDGMSEYEIAQELNVGRSTVQKFLERAKEKIEDAKMSSLFLLE
jgi:RNA polymerase sigma factor (sigma-70 family)